MTQPQSATNRRALWILLVILLAAFALRIHGLTSASMWFDERASVMSATGHLQDWLDVPLNQVIAPPDYTSVVGERSWLQTWRSPDFHPPLYALLLRWWRNLFGETDAAARGFSVLCSLAAIVFLFDLGRTLINTRSALWACAIMAVAQPEIQYAQEARGYALWAALAIAAFAATARLYVNGPAWRRAGALGVCMFAMLLTHFLAITSALAVVIGCLIYLRGRARRLVLIAAAIVILALAIAGGGLPLQAYRTHHDALWMREAPVDHIATTLMRSALIPARFLAEPLKGTEPIAAATAILYLLPLLMLRKNPAMALCALWLWIGVGVICLLDILMGTAALSYIRFTLAAAPAAYLIIASLPLRKVLKDILPMSAILGCLISLPATYEASWKGEWRELGHDLQRVATKDDLVVFASPADQFLADPAKLYEGVAYYAKVIPCPLLLLNRPIDAAGMERLRGAAHVWVVASVPAAQLPAYLPGWTFAPAAPKRLFAGEIWKAQEKK